MTERTGIRAVLTDHEILMLTIDMQTSDELTAAEQAVADRAAEKLQSSNYRAERRQPRHSATRDG